MISRLFIVFFLFILFCSSSYSSELIKGPVIKSTDLHVFFEPDKSHMVIKAVLNIENTEISDFKPFFNSKNFKITEIMSDNGEKITPEKDGQLVVKNLPEGKHRIQVIYENIIDDNGNDEKNKSINVIRKDLLELWDHTAWHPTMLGLYTIDYNITVTLPSSSTLEPVTCGNLIKKDISGDKKIYFWEAKNVRNGVSLFVAPYEIITMKSGKIEYFAFVLKDNKIYAEKALSFTRDVIEFMDTYYYEFPGNRFSLVEAPVFSHRNGRGVNGMCFLDSTVFPEIDKYIHMDVFLPHEISHTYWGSIINASLNQKNWGFDLIFFTEGLASFTAMDFYRQKGDSFALESCFIRNTKDFYLNKKEDEVLDMKDVDLTKVSKMALTAKICLMHYYLSELIGRDNYRKLLHELVDKYKFCNVTFSDFREILYNHCSDREKIDKFLELWMEKSQYLIPVGMDRYF